MKRDFVILGAGAAGLTAATLLARHGRSVTLVEASARPAPVLRGFRRKGLHFDTGFHYSGGLGPGEPLHTLLDCLGVMEKIETFPFDPEGFDCFRFEDSGFDFRFPYGAGRVRARLKEQFPDEAGAIDRYLDIVEEEYDASPYLNPKSDIRELGAFRASRDISLAEVLGGLVRNPHLNCLLSLHTLLHGVPPSEVTLNNHAHVVGGYYRSVRGIRGGGVSLVRAFEEVLDGLGVEILTGRAATSLLADSAGALKGVRLEDGEVLETTNCVFTPHPSLLLEMAPEGAFRPAYRRRLKELDSTSSAFLVYASLEGEAELLHRRNVFISPGTDCESFFRPETPVQRRPLYITAEQEIDGDRPRGVLLISVCHPEEVAPWADTTTLRRGPDYEYFKRARAAQIVEHAGAACPELDGRLEILDTSSPLTFRDWAGMPGGSMYGVKHKVGQYNPMHLTRLPGLYLAGQAVTGPGLLGAVISSFLACGEALGHDTLRREVRACL